jgi:hypothetical protein
MIPRAVGPGEEEPALERAAHCTGLKRREKTGFGSRFRPQIRRIAGGGKTGPGKPKESAPRVRFASAQGCRERLKSKAQIVHMLKPPKVGRWEA